MTAEFRPSDDILKQLVNARHAELARLQKSQADQLKDLETRGQPRLAELRKTLPKDMAAFLDSLEATHNEATEATKSHVESVKAELAASAPSPENAIAIHPGLAGGHLVAPARSLGWFSPYYGMLRGSDGSVYWQDYNPGNIDLSCSANGAGSGIFGTGAFSFTVYMDWYFRYLSPENRPYAHTIYVPFNGFYILYSNNGFAEAKEALARIDLLAVGYQYGIEHTPGSTNVFDLRSQNINVRDRFDGQRTITINWDCDQNPPATEIRMQVISPSGAQSSFAALPLVGQQQVTATESGVYSVSLGAAIDLAGERRETRQQVGVTIA